MFSTLFDGLVSVVVHIFSNFDQQKQKLSRKKFLNSEIFIVYLAINVLIFLYLFIHYSILKSLLV